MYTPFTKPLDHQARLYKDTASVRVFGLLWEQGTGKTKPTIDTIVNAWLDGQIDAVLVVAPNGVHRNWKSDELPKHVDPRHLAKMTVEFWDTQKANNVGFKDKMERLLKQPFPWLLMSYNSFMTKAGKQFVWRFLKKRKVFYVLDEAHNIAKPGAKRTKSIVASSVYAEWKRILTGTPVSVGPFDVYSQLKFLDHDIWKRHGYDNFQVFKTHFGVWFTAEDCKRLHGYDPGYDKLVEYRNIDQLEKIIKEISDRVLKDDVLDLPEKVYSKRYFELNGEQARVYASLRDELEAELEDGKRVDGALAITRLLRLHQVTLGYAVPDDPDEPKQLLGNHNPLLDEVTDWCSGLYNPAIIWCRFTHDIDQLMELLGNDACRYDGTLTDDECEKNKLDFNAGHKKWFIANAQKGGSGLTLNAAKHMGFYSQGYRYIDRMQAEDRFHRIGQEGIAKEGTLLHDTLKQRAKVDITDFEGFLPNGNPTVSRHIIDNLRGKFDIAAQITGDKLREWI